MNGSWEVIYYETSENRVPVKDFINSLGTRQKAKVMAFIGLLEENGADLPRPYADLLKDGIHELRVKLSGDQYRILYFFCYKEYIVLTSDYPSHVRFNDSWNMTGVIGSLPTNGKLRFNLQRFRYMKYWNVFSKTTAEVPEKEIDKAKAYRDDFLKRFKP